MFRNLKEQLKETHILRHTEHVSHIQSIQRERECMFRNLEERLKETHILRQKRKGS